MPLKLWAIGMAAFVIPMVVFFFALRAGRAKGDLTYIHKADPELENAIELAKRSLPDFVKTLQKPGPDVLSCAVKIKFATPKGSENMWVDHLTYKDKKFYGTLADKPVMLEGKAKGDAVSASQEDVVDWIVLHRGGLQEGAFTDAVLRRRQTLRHTVPSTRFG